jgi:dipeptidyl aminopeptidase/acylaminoacyl peptidase
VFIETDQSCGAEFTFTRWCLKLEYGIRTAVQQNLTTMSKALQQLLVAILLLTPTARADEAQTKTMPGIEPGIDKIAQLTAKEHSTILFTVADDIIGYARDGHVGWVDSKHNSRRVACSWPHPTLSHDGLRVAFVSDGDTTKDCRIVIHDIPTGAEQQLIEIAGDPGEISWSWDDTKIAFFDRGISAVSIRDGVKRVLLPVPLMKVGGQEFTFSIWDPIQWLHNDKDLVVELNTEVPTKEPGTYNQRSDILLVSGEEARVMDTGSEPGVSPRSDRLAYCAQGGLVAINADNTGKTILAKAPRTLFFKDEFFGKVTWSPDASRLFFGTIVSENRRDNLYLVDVKSGHREQFLSHTSITIRDWR